MRPRPPEFDSRRFAQVARIPLRTAQRWLARWLARGVAGIRRAKLPDRRRWCLLVAPAVVRQWKRGQLPVPFARAA